VVVVVAAEDAEARTPLLVVILGSAGATDSAQEEGVSVPGLIKTAVLTQIRSRARQPTRERRRCREFHKIIRTMLWPPRHLHAVTGRRLVAEVVREVGELLEVVAEQGHQYPVCGIRLLLHSLRSKTPSRH
jgi:hypothetical protein